MAQILGEAVERWQAQRGGCDTEREGNAYGG